MEALFMEKTAYFPLLPKDPKINWIRNGSGQIDYYIFAEILQEMP